MSLITMQETGNNYAFAAMTGTNTIQSNSYELSIRMFSDGFSFCVRDKNGQKISSKMLDCALWQQSAAEIENALCSVEELQAFYEKVNLTVETDIYTVVPKTFFTDENAEAFLKMQHSELKKENVLQHNDLPAFNAVLIFAVPKNLHKVFSQTMPDVEIQHHLSAFMRENITGTAETLVLVRKHKIDIIVIKNSIPALLNSFDYSTKEDIAYHILNVCNHLTLSPDGDNIKVYDGKGIDGLNEILVEYFRNCTVKNL